MSEHEFMDYYYSSAKHEWLLCECCIQAIKSRGEKLHVGDMLLDYEDSVIGGEPCEWCGEYADLYECM